MCVIAVCDAGSMLTDDEIGAMFYQNPDGAGIAFVDGQEVFISKGYMTESALKCALKEVPQDSPTIVHFRYSTSGGIIEELTHPYPVSSDLNELHALDVEAPIAIAHNGIISGFEPYERQGISDTVAFIQKALAPLYERKKDAQKSFIKRPCVKRLMRMRAPNNRFCLLDASKEFVLIGQGWTTLRNGVYVSNRNFIDKLGRSNGLSKSAFFWDASDEMDDWDGYDYDGFYSYGSGNFLRLHEATDDEMEMIDV